MNIRQQYKIESRYNMITGFTQLAVVMRYTNLLTGEESYSICKWVRNREEGQRYINLMTAR